MTPELITMLIGLAASVGFAVRSHFAARSRAEQTHGEAVAALIKVAELAEERRSLEEAAHGETAAKLAASEGRERALRAELSKHENGYRLMRPSKE